MFPAGELGSAHLPIFPDGANGSWDSLWSRAFSPRYSAPQLGFCPLGERVEIAQTLGGDV